METYLRVWEALPFQEVEKHLLIAGDTVGDCAQCRCLGISYDQTACPECKTEFKYVTSRRAESHPSEAYRIIRRLKEKRPDLVFIDYADYKYLSGKIKGRDLLA